MKNGDFICIYGKDFVILRGEKYYSKTKTFIIMNLEDIRDNDKIPGITPGIADNLLEAAVVCLSRQSHSSGVGMKYRGLKTSVEPINWQMSYDDCLDRAYADQEEATELGAVCISILSALQLTPYTIVQRARKRSGIDYWLAHKGDVVPFVHSARLEVSGIFNNPDAVSARINIKKNQSKQSDGTGLPAYISIVEFKEPSTNFIKK